MTIRTENPKAKPSRALGGDSGRPCLQMARLAERDGRLVLEATDSYEAVRVPITSDGEVELEVELLPAAAVKVLDSPRGELDLADGIVAHGRDGETVHYRPVEGNFPDLRELWGADPEEPLRFGVNVKLLKAVADALGGEKLEIVVDLAQREKDSGAYLRTIRVRNLDWDCGEGLLMPLRLNR